MPNLVIKNDGLDIEEGESDEYLKLMQDLKTENDLAEKLQDPNTSTQEKLLIKSQIEKSIYTESPNSTENSRFRLPKSQYNKRLIDFQGKWYNKTLNENEITPVSNAINYEKKIIAFSTIVGSCIGTLVLVTRGLVDYNNSKAQMTYGRLFRYNFGCIIFLGQFFRIRLSNLVYECIKDLDKKDRSVQENNNQNSKMFQRQL